MVGVCVCGIDGAPPARHERVRCGERCAERRGLRVLFRCFAVVSREEGGGGFGAGFWLLLRKGRREIRQMSFWCSEDRWEGVVGGSGY